MSNKKINLLGTAWTAPPWMKTNNDYTGFGFLKQEFYQLWAEYHIKYILLVLLINIILVKFTF